MSTLPKPEKPAPAPRRRIAPKCADCSCRERSHYGKTEVDPPGCAACGTCSGYVPHVPARSSVLRSPVARKKSGDKMGALGGLWPRCECKHGIAKHPGDRERLIGGPCKSCGCDRYRPRARKSAPARTKRKLMPKCKHCAYPFGRHDATALGSCPGYQPAIGIRQKRRTPSAALKLRCDNLWTAIVHARPEMCEVQDYHPHTCNGGYQAMHGVPRTFAATRWLQINGFKGCAGTHKFFTERPEAWSALLLEAWGLETFRELWSKARAMQPVDMSATYASLKAEAALRGIE